MFIIKVAVVKLFFTRLAVMKLAFTHDECLKPKQSLVMIELQLNYLLEKLQALLLDLLTSLHFKHIFLFVSLMIAGSKEIEYPFSLPCDDKPALLPSERNSQEAATVGLEPMQRANSTLEDFVSFIFFFVSTIEKLNQFSAA